MLLNAALALALGALPVDSIQLDTMVVPALPPVGRKVTLKLDFRVESHDAANSEMELTGTSTTTVTKSDETGVEETASWEDVRLVIAGSEQPMQFDAWKVKLTPKGDLLEIAGGFEGGDQARTFLVGMFPRPEKDLVKDQEATFVLGASKDGSVPERKISETYQTTESVAGQDAYKVKVKLEETKTGGLQMDGFFWLSKSGSLLKEEANFSNLPGPGNSLMAGKIKAISPST